MKEESNIPTNTQTPDDGHTNTKPMHAGENEPPGRVNREFTIHDAASSTMRLQNKEIGHARKKG